MSEKTYSVTITAKSGDRELTQVVYPGMDYGELVMTQAAISMGLLRAGMQKAVSQGEHIPTPMLELFGVKEK